MNHLSELLESAGLGGLPPEAKELVMSQAYAELELRVGRALSEGFSDAQMDEFSDLVDATDGVAKAWLDAHSPGWWAEFRMALVLGTTVREVATTKWLALNRPDYPSVIRGVLADMGQELARSRDAIWDRFGVAGNPPSGDVS